MRTCQYNNRWPVLFYSPPAPEGVTPAPHNRHTSQKAAQSAGYLVIQRNKQHQHAPLRTIHPLLGVKERIQGVIGYWNWMLEW